jgi:riboflavin kinase/FMN adenylyltransferase
VVNVGARPTFGGREVTVEAHLLDYSGDLYGRRLRLWFAARLRDEQRFAGAEALVEQIRRDVERARALVSAPPDGV